MRILAYLRHYPPPSDGGAYHINYHMFNALRKHGYQITIMSHSKVDPVQDNNFTVIPLKSIKTGRHIYATPFHKLIDLFKCVIAVRKHISKNPYDYIIFGAGYIQNLIIHLGTLGKDIKIIGIVLSEEISILQKVTRVRAWLQKWLLGKQNITIVISKYAESLIRSLGVNTPTLLIYPSLDSCLPQGKSEDRKRLVYQYGIAEKDLIVGFIGRHIERKGIENLFYAVEELNDKGESTSLLIAGKGPESEKLTQLIAQSKHREKYRMIGVENSEEKSLFLSGIDVFAMPNYEIQDSRDTEGFGIVFIEAAQQGTPVIAGKDGGVVEAVKDGFNGFNIDGSNIAEIVDAIECYYFDPALRIEHGENGKIWAEGFNWQAQVETLIHFLTAS